MVGTASAIPGTVQFALGAAESPLVSIGGENTALPLAAVTASSGLPAFGACLSARAAAATASRGPTGHAAGDTAPA